MKGVQQFSVLLLLSTNVSDFCLFCGKVNLISA